MNPPSDTSTPAASKPIPSLTGRRPIDEQLVDLDLLRALRRLERDEDTVTGRLDSPHAGLRVNVRAALRKSFREDVSGVAVRTNRQHAVWKRLQQRCLNPEVGVDRRELCADDAAADHRNPFGKFLGVAVRRLIRRHDALAVDLESRQRPRLGTGTDDHGFSAQRLAVYRDRTFRRQRAEPIDNGDLAPLEQARQALVQGRHDAAFALVDRPPVRRRLCVGAKPDPEIARMVDCSEYLRSLQQCLGGYTAAMQAGAAYGLLLDERHFLAGGSGVESGRVTAWAAAEYDDVEIGHALATSRSVCAISAGCGIVASSSAGLVGTGVFFAVIRATGWSRCQKHFSCTSAAISEPNPSLRAASCSTTALAVFLTDVTIVSMSSGTNVRISTTSTEIPSLSNSSATSTPCDTPAEYVISVTSRPSRTTLA